MMNKVSPDVQALLDAHKDVISTEPILMIDILDQQRARNKGYPKWLYHAEKEPVQVQNSAQETALKREMGYANAYIPQFFPAYMHRRNMDPKFEMPDLDRGRCGDFIESRLVAKQQDLDALLKERKSKTVIGEWCQEVAQLPAVEEGPSEDPKVTIARLEGQLRAQQQEIAADDAPRRGRPRKEEPAAA